MQDSQKRDNETEAERMERETHEREAAHKRALEEAAVAGHEQALLLKRKLQAGAPIEERDRRAIAPSFGPPIPEGIAVANLMLPTAANAASPEDQAQAAEPSPAGNEPQGSSTQTGTAGASGHSGLEAAHPLPNGGGGSRAGTASRGSPVPGMAGGQAGLTSGSGADAAGTRPGSTRGSVRMTPPSPSHSTLSKGGGVFGVDKLGSFGSASGRLLRLQASLPGSVAGDGEAPQLDADPQQPEGQGQHPQIQDAEEMAAEPGTPKHGHGLFERLDAGGQASPRKAA